MTGVSSEHRLLIDLCLRHLVPFFWHGPGLLLISRKGLPAILSELADRQLTILGLEGFELAGAEVRPRLDLIFDSGRVRGFQTAQQVIKDWPNDVWVDITISATP